MITNYIFGNLTHHFLLYEMTNKNMDIYKTLYKIGYFIYN